MNQRATARSLFFGAIGDLLSNFGAVLRIGGVWFAAYIALNAWAGRIYAHWVLYDVDQISAGPPGEWYVSALFLGMLGIVASAWHRFIYLGETARVIPRMRLVIIGKYMVAWVVIGSVATMSAVVLVCMPVLGLFLALGTSALDVLGALFVADWMRLGGISPWLIGSLIAMIAVSVWVSIFLLLRIGLGLPSIAVLDGQGLALGASWRATRSLGRAIFGASLWAALATCVLYGLVVALTPDLGESFDASREVGFRLAGAAVDIITMLVGAAMLTRIYGAVPSDAL
ncbi:hypothetical protein V8J83_03370 [Gymnodinialimonas sp. 2307UL20-7]